MSEKVEPLTVEELIGMKDTVLTHNVGFEIVQNGETKKIKREVTFRRLTYGEIDKLREIPEAEPLRYASAVIFMGSISPKFNNVDEIPKAPHGFVRHYSALILAESGKDPFLGIR